MKSRNATLRSLCRNYLKRLRYMARKHGLGESIDDMIRATHKKDCEPTEREVQMLSRMVDEERIKRTEVPKILGKQYDQCFNDDDFDKIKKLKRVGIYSRVNTILYSKTINKKKK